MLISSLPSACGIASLSGFSQAWKITHSLIGSLYSTDILPAHSIPSGHVLFHALRETTFFLFRQAASGRRDAFFEAVRIEFVDELPRVGDGGFFLDLPDNGGFLFG